MQSGRLSFSIVCGSSELCEMISDVLLPAAICKSIVQIFLVCVFPAFATPKNDKTFLSFMIMPGNGV